MVSETPRWRWLLGALLLVPVALTVVIAMYRHTDAQRREQAAAAEAEAELNAAKVEAHQLGGPWSAEEIDADRKAMPDDENSAHTLRLVAAKAPLRWPEWEFIPPPTNAEVRPQQDKRRMNSAPPPPVLHQKSFADLPPPALLTAAQREKLEGELKRAADALAVDKPRGHIPFSWPKTLSSLRYDHPDLGPAPTLLAYDAILKAQQGNADEALKSCRALLHVGAAIADTPTYPAQEVRTGIQNAVVLNLERILSLGAPSGPSLAAFQQRLEAEAELRPMLIAARGERAASDRFCQGIQRGELPVETFIRGTPMTERELMHARAVLLTRMTQRVEIHKLPPEQQLDRLAELPRSADLESPLVHALFTIKAVETYWPEVLASLRCAAAGLAVERYRQKHSRWPEKLADLVPEFLAAVPADPFDGAPLRLARREEGVAVYSIGRDKRDDGGRFDTLRNPKLSDDVGFRLWHPDRRRQAPK